MPPHIVFNHRHIRTHQLLAQVMHVIEPYVRDGAARDVSRELGELFFCSGVQIITEAHRALAGLPPRDHNGMTLDELRMIEHKMLLAMMAPAEQLFVNPDGQVDVERTMEIARECPKCRAADQAKMQVRGPHDAAATIKERPGKSESWKL